MLSNVRGISKSSHYLLSCQLIVFLNIVDCIAGGEAPHDGSHIDSGAGDARFAESNRWVHGYARINFHENLRQIWQYTIAVAEFHLDKKPKPGLREK